MCRRYHRIRSDNKPCRHGQGPRLVAVEFHQVGPRLSIEGPEIVRKRENQAKFFGNLIATINKYGKVNFCFLTTSGGTAQSGAKWQ